MNLTVHLFCLFVFSKSLVALASGIECDYSQYFLDYFKHNERSLLKMEKNVQNISLEDVLIFNEAVKTHDIVILVFLENLRMNDEYVTAYDLISINLYLNNFVNNLNIVDKDCNTHQEHSDPALKASNEESNNLNRKIRLIKGSKIIFRSLIERIEYQMKISCNNVNISDVSVLLKKPNVTKPYLPRELLVVNMNLKNETLKNFPHISHNYVDLHFHPARYYLKHILRNNIFGKIEKESKENDILNQSQEKINLIRFAPLNYKCPDGKNVTLYELNSYMYHNFDVQDLKKFQKIVFAAFFRPIAIIIRNFIAVVNKISSIKMPNKNSVTLKKQMIQIGYSIHYHIYKFKDFTCGKYSYTEVDKNGIKHFMNTIGESVYDIVYRYDQFNSKNLDKKLTDRLMKMIRNFMVLNKMKFSTKLQLNKIEEIDSNQVVEQASAVQTEVETYIMELAQWKHYLNDVLENQSLINSLFVSNKNELLPNEIINYLCQSRIHNEIDKLFNGDNLNVGLFEEDTDDINIDDTVYIDEEFKSDEFVMKEIDNDKMWSNQLFFTPKCLIHYFRYQ